MSVESPSPNEEKGKTLKAWSYHTPVMLKECVEGVVTDPNGVYVDATFGGGGHSRGILEKLKNGRLIAFDQDIEAVKQAELIVHRSFTFCKANFQYLSRYLKWLGVARVNGILADLGISSRQIDSPERGFSTRFDGPLDMRMNTALEKTAADVVAGYSEAELHRIFGRYGELKNARTTAKAVATARTRKPIFRPGVSGVADRSQRRIRGARKFFAPMRRNRRARRSARGHELSLARRPSG